MFITELKLRKWNETAGEFEYFSEKGELQRFTGYFDRYTKPIYEGDILDKQYHNLSVDDGIGVVSMGVGADSDGWLHGYWCGWKCGYSSLADVADECAIIGNIYQNPELLDKMDKGGCEFA